MENPFRSEAAAYRFLLVTIGALALIVAAKLLLGTIAALIVFVLELAVVTAFYIRQRAERPPPMTADHVGAPDEKRILVVANETVGGTALRNEIARRSEGYRTDVLVVCPALNSRVRTWTSDEDRARAEAQQRLDASLSRLAAAGVSARGEIGDGDPLQALEDALREFPADEIVVSTHPPGRSHWLEQGVVEQARVRYDVPVTHVVVDVAAAPQSA